MMINDGTLTMEAGEALVAFTRLKMSSGTLVAAGADDFSIGVALDNYASGDKNAVCLLRQTGTRIKMKAGAAVTQYAAVYGAASGEIDDAVSADYWGIALDAATADNDVIEVLVQSRNQSVPSDAEAHTADDTLVAAESGSIHTSVGAAGTITLTLPAATPGLEFWFQVGAAQQLRLDPNGTETISLPSTGVAGAAGKYLVADAIGETVHLKCCTTGTWAVFGFTGTWTAEA